ncbi:MAG: type VII secretion integral membrane protein EccD [Mycobacterium sp.]
MPNVRRVSVCTEDVRVDLALPSGVPVESLIPPLVDVVATRPGRAGELARYRLSTVGGVSLDASKTLAQHGIQDGSLLVLSVSPMPLPAPRFDDAADAVSTSLSARMPVPTSGRLTGALTAGWLAAVGTLVLIRMAFGATDVRQVTAAAGIVAVAGGVALPAGAIAHRGFKDSIAGVTLGLLAAGFAAAAGLLAVPGGPGAPNVLLAATAAAATAALALRITGCGTATFTALGCFAIVVAAAALVAATEAVPLRAIGAACTVVSLGLIEVSARLSIVLAGLSPRLAVQAAADRPPAASPGLPAKVAQADTWLTGLVAAFSASAALGAIGALIAVCSTTGSRAAATVFAAVTGAALLARSRVHPDLARTVALIVTGTAALSCGFVVAASAAAGRLPWIAVAMAALTAGTLSLAFIGPAVTWSPVARRGVELLEYFALAAVVPLACWVCGLFSAVRGLSLS